LENQVKEAKQMVEESDIKYDEVARKLAMVRLEQPFIQISLQKAFITFNFKIVFKNIFSYNFKNKKVFNFVTIFTFLLLSGGGRLAES
jgi:NADH:ubiquinone oxidoreductase subunit 3 (subunit A)